MCPAQGLESPPGSKCCIVFMTDGHQTDAHSCDPLAFIRDRIVPRRITIMCMGFWSDHDSTLLSQMAQEGTRHLLSASGWEGGAGSTPTPDFP